MDLLVVKAFRSFGQRQHDGRENGRNEKFAGEHGDSLPIAISDFTGNPTKLYTIWRESVRDRPFQSEMTPEQFRKKHFGGPFMKDGICIVAGKGGGKMLGAAVVSAIPRMRRGTLFLWVTPGAEKEAVGAALVRSAVSRLRQKSTIDTIYAEPVPFCPGYPRFLRKNGSILAWRV